MSYQKVTIVGGGTLGSQIAYVSAFHGKDVTVWGRSDSSLEKAQARDDSNFSWKCGHDVDFGIGHLILGRFVASSSRSKVEPNRCIVCRLIDRFSEAFSQFVGMLFCFR
ncbi:hypothetical protein H7R52_01985 [Weissella confusa]|uniref:3-hydroxyacyl-CoA dehydrogenase NAD binding domain-containing protein n=1 Tax=Weissella confusa TaxID=1583 RepID=A0A923NE16_WEICO|nr:hypothetical protein [Weissella confusa]